jgi:hypothetical protein
MNLELYVILSGNLSGSSSRASGQGQAPPGACPVLSNAARKRTESRGIVLEIRLLCSMKLKMDSSKSPTTTGHVTLLRAGKCSVDRWMRSKIEAKCSRPHTKKTPSQQQSTLNADQCQKEVLETSRRVYIINDETHGRAHGFKRGRTIIERGAENSTVGAAKQIEANKRNH